MDAEIELGSRVLIKGHKCTIHYIGELDGKEGIYIGTEFDDFERQGKHFGIYNNVRYFTPIVRFHPSSSFIKLDSTITHGCSFSDAYKDKYGM